MIEPLLILAGPGSREVMERVTQLAENKKPITKKQSPSAYINPFGNVWSTQFHNIYIYIYIYIYVIMLFSIFFGQNPKTTFFSFMALAASRSHSSPRGLCVAAIHEPPQHRPPDRSRKQMLDMDDTNMIYMGTYMENIWGYHCSPRKPWEIYGDMIFSRHDVRLDLSSYCTNGPSLQQDLAICFLIAHILTMYT